MCRFQEESKGCSKEEVENAGDEAGAIPAALEFFYLKYGKLDELQYLQDYLILPNRYEALMNQDYVIFFDENQSVCQAGIKKADAMLQDPSVYVRMNGGEWLLSADCVTDFLSAMYGYQASMCLEYSPEEF